MQTTLYPNALDRYACKCGECRRTCCRSDWDITLSSSEAERARDADVRLPGKAVLGDCIERNPDGRDANDAWRMRMGASGSCVALDGDGMCSWQLATGHCSGRTCDEFPRSAIDCGDMRWLHATVGCEAVVESLLGRQDPIAFVEVGHPNSPFTRLTPQPNIVMDESALARRPLLSHYPAILSFAARVIQDRSLALGERLCVLAHAFFEIDHLESIGACGRIPDLLGKYDDPRERVLVASRYGGAPGCDNAWLTLMAKVYGTAIGRRPQARDFPDAVLGGIGLETGPAERRVPKVDLVRPQAVGSLPAIGEVLEIMHCPLLEHLCVIEFARSATPITKPGVYLSFAAFVAWFIVMALSVRSVAATHGGALSREEVVDAIVRVQRCAIHNGALSGIAGWMAGVGMSRIDTLCAIVVGACGGKR